MRIRYIYTPTTHWLTKAAQQHEINSVFVSSWTIWYKLPQAILLSDKSTVKVWFREFDQSRKNRLFLSVIPKTGAPSGQSIARRSATKLSRNVVLVENALSFVPA